ncbi:hypothetical protein QYE76_005005 [Lolium multiflorum]|uniref:SprT-like domain-containing protein n=1 Tax=Lolium multiflorum TaxID=4521 RepID=A0AAD8W0B4_LOLMU|nr:hypothetical protein QYE76_005005 [Lolium multiflorum]
MGLGADPDDDGENPDVWQLFRHYDKLYFRGVLVDAGFSVEWTQPRMKTISSFGSCSFGESNTITLYEPILKYRTNADLKNALLHLMIHAFLSVKCDAKGIWGHGPAFRGWMHALNTCSIDDRLRPTCGYCITTTHDFSPEKCGNMQGFWWKCESCGVTLLRAKKLGPPSDSCCIENVSQDATCGNMLCNWHNHKVDCGGTYVVTKSPETPGQQMVQKGRRGFLTEMSEMLRSQGATQESDSDEVQENLTVAKLKAEGKLLSQVGGRNARSPGSSSLKKASKSNMLEDFQKAIVLPATPRRKLKLKQEHFSMISVNNAKSQDRCSSKKAEDFQKAIVPSASPPSKLKRKQASVASEKHELISLASCNSAKSLRSNTSRKADKWHEPEQVQKSSVQPSASQKQTKLEQDLGVSEKYGVSSPGSYNTTKPPGSSMSRKAGKRHTPEGVEKSSIPVAAPKKKLKIEPDLAMQQNKTSSSIKAGKQLNPEDFQKTFVQPVVYRKKLKLEPDLVALDKNGDAKPLGCSTGNKEIELHKLEVIRKASVPPAAPPRKLKHDVVASQKSYLSSFVGRSNANVLDNISSKMAHKQLELVQPQKPITRPAAPRSILKQQSKTNTLTKEGKQQIPEYSQRTFVQPAVSQSKLKQSSRAAPERPKTRSKTINPSKKKEYACVSVWANIYESECSSGSAEPLVNKRTERRKRERERAVQITYSRSRKRSASGISSIKAQPAEEEISSQQTKSPSQSQCLKFILINAANKVVTQDPRDQSKAPAPRKGIVIVPPADQVTTQTARGRSQPQAPRMDIVTPPADLAMTQTHGDLSVPSRRMDIAAAPLAEKVMTRAPADLSQLPALCSIATNQVVPPHSADPLSLTPSNPSSSPDVIDISDDD